MSRILFSTISGIPRPELLPCFYEGFINALLREGNDVMLMITNKFHSTPWTSNNPHIHINTNAVHAEVAAFKPDLIITCNNSLFAGIPDQVDCPILVWAMDSPPLFCDQRTLKKDVGRYHFICPTTEFYSSLKSHFQAKDDQMHLIAYASDFAAEPVEQTIPISFVGTKFLPTAEIKSVIYEDMNDESVRNDLKKFLTAFENDVLLSPEKLLHTLSKPSQQVLKKIPHVALLNLLSSNIRSQTLYHIHDLGLHLYGSKSWYDFFDFSLPFAFCYQDKSICTVAENQNLYNSSKIAINITHVQAKNTFGWRVRDIMATNACLVSDYREDIKTLFSKYVDIPVFHNPYEARTVCEKVLKDDIWRKEIVAGSQLAIEEGHRFNHRLIELEKTFGLDLHPKNDRGTFRQLHSNEFSYRPEHISDASQLESGAPVKLDKIPSQPVIPLKVRLFEFLEQHKTYIAAYQSLRRRLPYSLKAKIRDRFNFPSPAMDGSTLESDVSLEKQSEKTLSKWFGLKIFKNFLYRVIKREKIAKRK